MGAELCLRREQTASISAQPGRYGPSRPALAATGFARAAGGTTLRCMPARHTRLLLIVSLLAMPGASTLGQSDDDKLTEIKEVELEQVRQQISNLKKSMDRRAAERDEVTAELQAAEGEIAEIRQNLRDLERQRQFTLGRKNKLQAQLADELKRLERETGLLAAQVKAAYTSGSEDRIKLLLNQADPAALGRQRSNGSISKCRNLIGDSARHQRLFSHYQSRHADAARSSEVAEQCCH